MSNTGQGGGGSRSSWIPAGAPSAGTPSPAPSPEPSPEPAPQAAASGGYAQPTGPQGAPEPMGSYPQPPIQPPGPANSGAFGPPGAGVMGQPPAQAPVQPAVAVPVAAAPASPGAAPVQYAPPTVDPTMATAPARPAVSATAPVVNAPPLQPAIDDSAFYSLEDEGRMRWCMKQIELLKGQFGGRGRLKRDTPNTKVYLMLPFEDREAKLEVDYDTGWMELSLPVKNPTGVSVRLKYDESKTGNTAQPAGVSDEWEEESDEVTHVFVPGVYVEDDEDDVRQMVQVVNALPPAAQQAIFMSLQRKIVDSYWVYSDEIQVGFGDEFYAMKDAKQQFERALKCMYVWASFLEKR